MNFTKDLDPNRLQRQMKGINLWVENGCRGTGEYCTGFGKTIMASIAISKMLAKDSTKTTIVCVPTDHLREQWRGIVIKFGLKNVYVETWHTLVKSNHECDLFIVDEVHSNTAPLSGTVFECVRHKWLLCLTASLKADENLDFSITDIAPVFDSVSLREAERNGWVSNFTVYNLAVPLSQKDQKEYEAINNRYMKYFSTFEFDFDMAMNALKDKSLRERIARRLNWEEKVVMLHALGYNRSMRERKTFLYTTESIIRTAVAIAEKFSDRKIITFSEATSAADKLTDLLPDSASYHSQLQTILVNGKKKGPATRKKEAMKNFTEDKIRILNTARALNVGADIPNVDMSIICSFNSSLIDSIQRTGRAVRYAEGKHAIEVNLYIPKAQSEKWLRSKQKKTPNIKWITSMDQIV